MRCSCDLCIITYIFHMSNTFLKTSYPRTSKILSKFPEVLFLIWINNPPRAVKSEYRFKAQFPNVFSNNMFREHRLSVKFPVEEVALMVTIRSTKPTGRLAGLGQLWPVGQTWSSTSCNDVYWNGHAH